MQGRIVLDYLKPGQHLAQAQAREMMNRVDQKRERKNHGSTACPGSSSHAPHRFKVGCEAALSLILRAQAASNTRTLLSGVSLSSAGSKSGGSANTVMGPMSDERLATCLARNSLAPLGSPNRAF